MQTKKNTGKEYNEDMKSPPPQPKYSADTQIQDQNKGKNK